MSNAPEKSPGLVGKIKEKIRSSEEELDILSTFVRLGILIWSGGILTLTYVNFPMFPQQKIDPTFIASVFTGTLATFGVQAGKKHNAPPVGPVQTIKIEQKPLKIVSSDD